MKLIKAGLWDHANAGSAGRDVEMALRFGLIDRPCQIAGRDDLAPGPQDHEGGYGNSRFSEAIIKGELDDVPEQAFLNVGGVDQVLAKAKALQDSAA